MQCKQRGPWQHTWCLGELRESARESAAEAEVVGDGGAGGGSRGHETESEDLLEHVRLRGGGGGFSESVEALAEISDGRGRGSQQEEMGQRGG